MLIWFSSKLKVQSSKSTMNSIFCKISRGVFACPPPGPMPRLDYGVYFDMRDFALYCYFKYSALLSTAVLPSIMQNFPLVIKDIPISKDLPLRHLPRPSCLSAQKSSALMDPYIMKGVYFTNRLRVAWLDLSFFPFSLLSNDLCMLCLSLHHFLLGTINIYFCLTIKKPQPMPKPDSMVVGYGKSCSSY